MSTVPTPSTPDANRRAATPEPPLPHDQAAVYPIPRADDDPRFTFGLTLDVVGALARHGYPIAAGGDFVALQRALFTFLYGTGRVIS